MNGQVLLLTRLRFCTVASALDSLRGSSAPNLCRARGGSGCHLSVQFSYEADWAHRDPRGKLGTRRQPAPPATTLCRYVALNEPRVAHFAPRGPSSQLLPARCVGLENNSNYMWL